MADDNELRDLLLRAVDLGASDLHFVTGHPPIVRVHGEMRTLGDGPLSADHAHRQMLELCDALTAEKFASGNNVDFALKLPIADGKQTQRFRANYFTADGEPGACFRVIPAEIPELDWAGFPFELAERLVGFRNGLVLVAGVTGAGKTTSLAMLVNLLNQSGGRRIITIEEPIEYVHARYRNSVVTQREVGRDVGSFSDGLKYGLRQDPDVLLVGEIRDPETAKLALSAAETGHLVLSTLHTRDAKGAITRMSDFFPEGMQTEVRSQLSMSLRAVLSQHLVPGLEKGGKRELAMEVMINNSPIASGIRQGRFETIDNNIQTGAADGMQTFDDAILSLLKRKRIGRDTAARFLKNADLLGW